MGQSDKMLEPNLKICEQIQGFFPQKTKLKIEHTDEWDWIYLCFENSHVYDLGLMTVFKNGEIRLYSDGLFLRVDQNKQIQENIDWWKKYNDLTVINKILDNDFSALSDDFLKAADWITEYAKNHPNVSWSYIVAGIPGIVVKSEKVSRIVVFKGCDQGVWIAPNNNYQEFSDYLDTIL